MSRTVRSLAVLALAAWFLAGTVPAVAAPLTGPAGAESLWSAAWDWLLSLIAQQPGPNGDAGGGIDPDGQTNSDAGGTVDPNG